MFKKSGKAFKRVTMKSPKKWTTRHFRQWKKDRSNQTIEMLTCYDFQMAQMFAETEVDLLLVGDSVGNVVLGYETTVEVTLDEMKLFGAAVKRGAPDKFTIVDMPFGTYINQQEAIKNAVELFRSTKAEALKVEGANEELLPPLDLWSKMEFLSVDMSVLLPNRSTKWVVISNMEKPLNPLRP